MPDFDPQTIPTLDDVIEAVEPENIEKDNNPVETEPVVIDDEPALFAAEPVIDFATNIDDENIEVESNTATTSETEIIESALIHYNAEHDDDSSIEDNTNETDEMVCEIDEPPGLPTEPPTESLPLITPVELQTITDNIVSQLMPELEQRLRVLIQQTLEEKLPPSIFSPKSTTSTNIED